MIKRSENHNAINRVKKWQIVKPLILILFFLPILLVYQNCGQPVDSGFQTSVNSVDFEGKVEEIAVGGSHACALRLGQVYCWGLDTYGQLGNGANEGYAITPTLVPNLSNIKKIIAGFSNTCAINSNGKAFCWGRNLEGQLGNGTTVSSSVPTEVVSLSNAKEIYLKKYDTYAVDAFNKVYYWGKTFTSTNVYNITTPVLFFTFSDIKNIIGGQSIYLLRSTGDVYRQVLYAGPSQYNTPQFDSYFPNTMKVVASSGDFLCVIGSDGHVNCRGVNTYGQLGIGTTSYSQYFQTVSSIANVIDLDIENNGGPSASYGGGYGCAVDQIGEVFCWGNNYYGQLGNGSTLNSTLPVKVNGLSDIKSVSLGVSHACALSNFGQIYCWGRNGYGLLGNGTRADSLTPQLVQGF